MCYPGYVIQSPRAVQPAMFGNHDDDSHTHRHITEYKHDSENVAYCDKYTRKTTMTHIWPEYGSVDSLTSHTVAVTQYQHKLALISH